MDLNTMENKIKNRRYRYLEDFEADAYIVLHNTFICYGGRYKGQIETKLLLELLIE